MGLLGTASIRRAPQTKITHCLNQVKALNKMTGSRMIRMVNLLHFLGNEKRAGCPVDQDEDDEEDLDADGVDTVDPDAPLLKTNLFKIICHRSDLK